MKRCPECRRNYYDDTLLYCLDDGNALLEGFAGIVGYFIVEKMNKALSTDMNSTDAIPYFLGDER